MNKDSRIYIAGHRGLVGSAIKRKLESLGYTNLIFKTRQELDLTNQQDVEHFFHSEKPEYVFLAAAKVGGILHNKNHPADFIIENLQIQNNVITNSYKNDVKKLLFLGSSCIYPKFAKQPIEESEFLSGKLEETNDAYAVAKIAGIAMCKALRVQHGFNAISLMPTNLYGPEDNFDLNNSHVLPALIRKFHEAKENGEKDVYIWGDGSAIREFLYVDDLADASYFCMKNYNDSEIINVGTGIGTTIKFLAFLISDIINYNGNIKYDTTKPNGTPKKVLNIDKIKSLGWEYKIHLPEGIEKTYEWYLKNKKEGEK